MKIVILDGYMANPGDLSWDAVARLGDTAVYDRTAPDEVVERAKDAQAVFVNKVLMTDEILGRLPRLKFIGVMATGYNNIDVKAACRRGVCVCNVPAYSTEAVAQTVFALLLEITNRVGRYSSLVHSGQWAESKDFSFTLGPITELSGLTMGVYGFGNIGRRVAAIASAFGMNVISPTSQPRENLPGYVAKVTFDEFLAQSDIISVNSPLTDANRHIFNDSAFEKMRRGVILINTARGPLIDEQALADALESGQVGAAGVDVLEQEPPRSGSPLIGAPRCFITPHIAWQSVAARRRLIDICAANLAAFVAGKPINVVS